MGEFSDGRQGTWCSGALIDKKNKVLTAAHCVYNHSDGKIWILRGEVIPARGLGNTPPYGSAQVIDYYFPAAYLNEKNYAYDYAVLILDSNIGNQTGWLNLKYSPEITTSTSIGIYGYPSDLIRSTGRVDQYGMRGYPTAQTTQLLYHQLDTEQGMSGSPILSTAHEILGVHVAGDVPRNTGV